MKKLTLAMAAALALSATAAHARDNIEIVGSSTVYPFSTSVAETFAKKTGNALLPVFLWLAAYSAAVCLRLRIL